MIRAGYDYPARKYSADAALGCGSFSTDKSEVASGPFPLGDESDVTPSLRL